MNPQEYLRLAISGKLVSVTPGGPLINYVITNNLPIPISIYAVQGDGSHYYRVTLAPQASSPGYEDLSNWFFLVKSAATGALISLYQATSGLSAVIVDHQSLMMPGDIGGIPQPTSYVPLPMDSPRILVGAGTLPNGNIVTREQFWARCDDSYALAAGETRVVNYTVTNGMQSTSSDQSSVSASVGASVSAGWGPVSASVSASLSTNSSVSHQVTVSSQSTRFESLTLKGDPVKSRMVLKWQLMDMIYIYDRSNLQMPIATIESGESPVIVESFDMPIP